MEKFDIFRSLPVKGSSSSAITISAAVMMAAADLSVRSGDRYSWYSADNQEEEATFGNPTAGTQTLIIQIFHKPYFQI